MGKKRKGKSKKIRVKVAWSEFRARLSSGSKLKLLSIIKILWSSSSITAKNKCIKMAAMKSFAGKIKRKSKAKTKKGKSKSKKRRTPAQVRATRKLVAFNKRKRR